MINSYAQAGSRKLHTALENLEFSGYLSRGKVISFFAFMSVCLACVAFGNGDDQAYFRWLFEPWARPVRWFVILGLIGIELAYLKLIYLAFRGIPVVQVSNLDVSVNYGKKGSFNIVDIEKVVKTQGQYHVHVGKRKYVIDPLVFLDSDILREKMEILSNIVVNKHVF